MKKEESVEKVKIASWHSESPPRLFRALEEDCCYDLSASETVKIAPRSFARVPLGISLMIPDGHKGLLRLRSGLACFPAMLTCACIDSSYRGQVFCCLANLGEKELVVEEGERVVQLVILRDVMDNGVYLAQASHPKTLPWSDVSDTDVMATCGNSVSVFSLKTSLQFSN